MWFILVWVCTQLLCSVDHGIALNVYQLVCLGVKGRGTFPFISQGAGLTSLSLRQCVWERESFSCRGGPPPLVVRSSASSMVPPITLVPMAGSWLTSLWWHVAGPTVQPWGLIYTTWLSSVVVGPSSSFRAHGFSYSVWRPVLFLLTYWLLLIIRCWGHLWPVLLRPIRVCGMLIL